MAFGFEAKNTDGYVVIDTVYNNLCLQQKYDFSVGAGGTFSVSQGNCDAPLMCINATGYVGFYGLSVSGATYTWRFKAAEASSGSVYIFDRPQPVHTSPFGMKILAADGVTEMFNSDNRYLRVAGILDVPWSASYSNQAFIYVVTGGTASNTSLPSAKYAVCASMSRVNSSSLGNNNFRRTFDGVKTTSTSVSVAQVVNIDFFAGGGGEHPGVFAFSGSGTQPALIVNVEGF
jgi:hypothetical protein